MNKSLFDEAIAEWKHDRNIVREIERSSDDNESNGHPKSSSLKNDENPRPTPSPHPSPTQVKTPNAPAPEESLCLSFDETTSNCDKNHSEKKKENTKTLAPRFKQTPNTSVAKPVSSKSDNFSISRQPFKQITPQDQNNSPMNFLECGKPVVRNRNQATRKGENKENTPLTSRNVPNGNVNRKSPNVGAGRNVDPFSERSNKVPRGQTGGVHPERTLSDKHSSNPRAPLKVNQALATGVRQRCRSEDIQSYHIEPPENTALHRTRANSHSSQALSDEDNLSDISLNSSFTNATVKRPKSQSPSYFNRSSNQTSPRHQNHSPKILASNGESWSLESKQSACVNRGEVDTRNQKHAETRQNSPKICGILQQSFGDKTSPLSNPHTHQRSFNTPTNTREHFSDRKSQQTKPGSHQSTRVTSDDDKRQRYGNSTSQGQNTLHRRISDMRQFSPNDSGNGTSHQFHGNPDIKPSSLSGTSQSISSHHSYTRHGIPKGSVGTTPKQQSDDYEKQQANNIHNEVNEEVMFSNSGDMTNQHSDDRLHDTDTPATELKYGKITGIVVQPSPPDTSRNTENEALTKYKHQKSSLKRPSSTCSSASCDQDQESEKNPSNFIQHESPNIYADAAQQISPSRVNNDSSQRSPSNVNNASRQPKKNPRLIVSDAIYSENELVEGQGNNSLINEQQGREENLTGDRELKKQVKKQEEMIRVLQEQVRSLLRMKEAISSESPSLPLTPASTPKSAPGDERRLSNQSSPTSGGENITHSQTVDGKQLPTSVTIGVNTGASLLWESSRDDNGGCEKCREGKRLQSDQAQQDVQDKAEPSEHPDVFLIPESLCTESLICPSQVDVQVDSTPSSTPPISNMIIPSMSAEGVNRLSQAVSTSQEESTNENEVPVKGREFYDKLLFQVKDLLSEQVSTKQDDRTEEQHPASQTTHVPTREVVVKATLRQLEKIRHSGNDVTQQSSTRVQAESSSVFSTYQRSLSTSFIPEYPRLNYMSMSVDDTFDEVTYIDEVAMKYLSDEELKQFKSDVCPSSSGAAAVKRSVTRTVRFGSLPSGNEHRSMSRRSVREVDFTWNNLSFCTKDYLTKYNLVEGHVSFTDGDSNDPERCRSKAEEERCRSKAEEKHSRESSLDIEPCKPPFPSPARRHSEGSSHILDIKRLKNLPKLF